jgi:hypothetical protein
MDSPFRMGWSFGSLTLTEIAYSRDFLKVRTSFMFAHRCVTSAPMHPGLAGRKRSSWNAH